MIILSWYEGKPQQKVSTIALSADPQTNAIGYAPTPELGTCGASYAPTPSPAADAYADVGDPSDDPPP
eukprot:CAMPEP_0183292964 /NCGR_PEP_ID=MMETSP0160_2-20130417/1838_1 /TAXON_ID=2839 ORGANISM="Odontella Sinensis, Strain Grunow 1884" /NCGR_SAMPLE_ID=MMETSP0160_2 /ASSEMBLY_ACC=CAM_ASM_000250 /LENGTH=67 /DNA_ID=CAMNT_0025454009 /DNA_START=61 /DNA_END=260 /DNA_ORIENTATION=+